MMQLLASLLVCVGFQLCVFGTIRSHAAEMGSKPWWWWMAGFGVGMNMLVRGIKLWEAGS